MGEFARGHEEWVVEVTCARYARVLWLLLMLCLVLFVVVSSVLLHCLCFFMRFPPENIQIMRNLRIDSSLNGA